MSKILKRPMFKKGGSVGEGIMSKVEPRQNYANGPGPVNMPAQRPRRSVKSYYEELEPIYSQALRQKESDSLSNFLIRGGLNLIEKSDKDASTLQNLASAYREPTEIAMKEKAQRKGLESQAKLGALSGAVKLASRPGNKGFESQTIASQFNKLVDLNKDSPSYVKNAITGAKPQIEQLIRQGRGVIIATPNLRRREVDPGFYEGKADGTLYINPFTFRVEAIVDGRPFTRIDQKTLQPITNKAE